MYAAQNAPASSASATPAVSSPLKPPKSKQQDARPGQHDPEVALDAIRRSQRRAAHELEGDRHAERDAVEGLVEGEVHPGERDAERGRQRQVARIFP